MTTVLAPQAVVLTRAPSAPSSALRINQQHEQEEPTTTAGLLLPQQQPPLARAGSGGCGSPAARDEVRRRQRGVCAAWEGVGSQT